MSVAKAKLFLESNMYAVDDPYTTVLTAYALTLLRSPLAGVALRKVNSLAITQGKKKIPVPLAAFLEVSICISTEGEGASR